MEFLEPTLSWSCLDFGTGWERVDGMSICQLVGSRKDTERDTTGEIMGLRKRLSSEIAAATDWEHFFRALPQFQGEQRTSKMTTVYYQPQ